MRRRILIPPAFANPGGAGHVSSIKIPRLPSFAFARSGSARNDDSQETLTARLKPCPDTNRDTNRKVLTRAWAFSITKSRSSPAPAAASAAPLRRPSSARARTSSSADASRNRSSKWRARSARPRRPIACHVGRLADLENLVATTTREFGRIDILVNNAGTNVGQGPCLAVDEGQFDKMIEVNLKSAFRLTKLVAPGMCERGSGSIINMSSISGLRPQFEGLLYSMTKAALIMMTQCYALELGPKGVRVNAIAPGMIETVLSEYYWKDEARRAQILAQAAHPAHRQAAGRGRTGAAAGQRPRLLHHRPDVRGRWRLHALGAVSKKGYGCCRTLHCARQRHRRRLITWGSAP